MEPTEEELMTVRLFGHQRARQVRTAWGTLLSEWPWTYYMTWTFRDRVGPNVALTEVREHLRFMEWTVRGAIGWVVALEQERGADRPHAHGLVCGPRIARVVTRYSGTSNERRAPLLEVLWRAWLERNGAGRFEPVRGPVDPVSFYCSKSAARDGEILISDNLEKFRRRRRPSLNDPSANLKPMR